uniref:L antigen family member 3 n=1 Tax=Equus asinus asinus TaxID=83772 RepID=A0A8C4MJS5_EQUAS
MQAADAGAGGGAGGADGRDGQDGQGLRGGGGAAASAAGGAPRVTRVQHASGPGVDAASTARRLESRLHMFALSVPFPSSLEAEIAHGSLAPDAEPHRGAVWKELSVIGSVLAVRWRAEDSRLLRISIINFLDQLSLVVGGQVRDSDGPVVLGN